MSGDYWIGLATIPAVLLATRAAMEAYFWTINTLEEKFGIALKFRWERHPGGPSGFILRRDIWWERAFGPIFVGGWYHEMPGYERPDRRLFSRWIGVGRADGPCFTITVMRDLGAVVTEGASA